VAGAGTEVIPCCPTRGDRLGDLDRVPCGAAICDPLLRSIKACGFDPASPDAAELFCLYQAAVLQHLQVLDDSGQGDVERFGQARDRYRSFA